MTDMSAAEHWQAWLDRYGDVYVDTAESMAVFEEWQQNTRPAAEHGQDGLRRPMHLKRVCRPSDDTFKL